MSGDEATNAQVGMLIKQSGELAGAVKEIAQGVSTLLQFQAAQNEHNESNKDWKQGVERHQEKQDIRMDKMDTDLREWKRDEFQPVRDGQQKNSLIVNAGIGLAGASAGICGTLLTLYFGG